MAFTEDAVKDLLANMPAHQLWRPLFRLWLRQTPSERHSSTTKNLNGVGFNAHDAGFAGSLVRQYANRKSFSPKQATALRKMLIKYRRQLTEIANGVDGPCPDDGTLLSRYSIGGTL